MMGLIAAGAGPGVALVALMANRRTPIVIGDGIIPEVPAFYDVRDALEFDEQIVLGAFIAKVVGQTLPEDSIIYNLEPLYEGCNPLHPNVGYLDLLKKHKVLDYQRKNVEYLKTLGIDAFHMPFGYHPSMERCKPAEKDIDVLFFGSMHPRRLAIIHRFQELGINIVAVKGAYGADRDALVSRAKIVINMHYRDDHPLETVRLNYLMANKAFIVSERGWDDEENAVYQDGLVFTEYDDLVDACITFLSVHKTVRTRIGETGYELIKARPQSKFSDAAKRWLHG